MPSADAGPRSPDELRTEALWIAADRAALQRTCARWLVHHLRTPLQSVALMSEILRGAPDEEGGTGDWLAMLDAGARDITASISQLDRLLRPLPTNAEAGPVALAGVLQTVGDLHAYERTQVVVAIDLGAIEELPAVAGVEEHLTHVLLGLVLNAKEALGVREGTVRLDGRLVDGMVELVVEDDGPGVADEIVPCLFAPFVSTRQRGPASGLGLAVARRLLGRAGGTIAHERPAAGGARFTIRLPVWQRG